MADRRTIQELAAAGAKLYLKGVEADAHLCREGSSSAGLATRNPLAQDQATSARRTPQP